MAQQTINVGASANDGTGDTIRDAFTKSNSNFTELYNLVAAASLVADDTAPVLGGNLDVAGFDIVSSSNGNIEIIPDGTGLLRLSGLVLNGNSFGTQAADQNISFVTTGAGRTNINAVNITGGDINGVSIGATTAGQGIFLNVFANNVTPNLAATYDLGSDSVRWQAGYFKSVNTDQLRLANKQTITVSGAINLTKSYVEFDTTAGAIAASLANGSEGQIVTLILKVDGGSDVTITPTTPLGYASITLDDAGDSVTLLYTSAGWAAIAEIGTAL